MDNTAVHEPKGIPFYSIKTGETHYAKLEPTIAAYINSSNLGINASRGQDYGWRLGADWVKRVQAFKRNPTQMSILTAKNQGQKPTTVQILYYIYGEELSAYYEAQEENENPFEEQYQQDVTGKGARADVSSDVPKALADFQEGEDDMADLIDDVIAEDEPAPEKPAETKPASTAKSADKPAAKSSQK